MLPTTILTIVDGVRVVVPDSLDMITPYVLREQQDWFEDEIKFLRRLLQPGDKVTLEVDLLGALSNTIQANKIQTATPR